MELPNILELTKIIDLCNKKGLKSLRVGELTLEFKELIPSPLRRIRKKQTENIKELSSSEPSVEDLINWGCLDLTQEAV